MIWAVPAFKSLFASFGANLPAPTLVVMAMSEFTVKWWWLIFGRIGGTIYFFFQAWRRSLKVQRFMDVALLPFQRRAGTPACVTLVLAHQAAILSNNGASSTPAVQPRPHDQDCSRKLKEQSAERHQLQKWEVL